MPVYTWLDPGGIDMAAAMTSLRSFAGLVHAPSRGCLLRCLAFGGRFYGWAVVVVVIGTPQEWGSCLPSSACPWRSNTLNTFTSNATP